MNQAHADMDDMGEWAESHPITQRAHRALPLDHAWPTRRAYIPQGCDQQDRLEPTIKPAEPRLFAGVGQDRMPEDFDEEDQTDSADRDVTLFVLKFITAIVSACFLAWVGGAL